MDRDGVAVYKLAKNGTRSRSRLELKEVLKYKVVTCNISHLQQNTLKKTELRKADRTVGFNCNIYRGYYTVARRYEFYVRVATTISHE